MALPPRESALEDAFVEDFRDGGDTDALIAAITEALEERRPRLAARLVGLLDRHVEIEPGSAVERARRAAQLIVVRRNEGFQQAWDDLEDAWKRARQRRMRRIRARQRRTLGGRTPRPRTRKRR